MCMCGSGVERGSGFLYCTWRWGRRRGDRTGIWFIESVRRSIKIRLQEELPSRTASTRVRWIKTKVEERKGEREQRGQRQVHLLADYTSAQGVNNSWHLGTLLVPTPASPAVPPHRPSPVALNLPSRTESAGHKLCHLQVMTQNI